MNADSYVSENRFSKKFRFCLSLIILCLSVLTAGCSNQKEKEEDLSSVFTAVNHLCEADTLAASGTYDITNIGKGDFRLWIDNDSKLEIAFDTGENPRLEIGFYLRDGKTYLNFLGTKSQSLAANIGIEPDTRLQVYNPFLDLDESQRAELFSSVSRNGNEYTLEINKQKLAAYLDSYGSVGVKKAVVTADIENDEIRNLSIDLQIRTTMTATMDITAKIDLHVDSMNEPLDIPWPEDLASW